MNSSSGNQMRSEKMDSDELSPLSYITDDETDYLLSKYVFNFILQIYKIFGHLIFCFRSIVRRIKSDPSFSEYCADVAQMLELAGFRPSVFMTAPRHT